MENPNSKYVKGEKIKSLDELMQQDFIYFHERLLNLGWFQNWYLHFARQCINSGVIRKAVLREPEEEKNT